MALLDRGELRIVDIRQNNANFICEVNWTWADYKSNFDDNLQIQMLESPRKFFSVPFTEGSVEIAFRVVKRPDQLLIHGEPFYGMEKWHTADREWQPINTNFIDQHAVNLVYNYNFVFQPVIQYPVVLEPQPIFDNTVVRLECRGTRFDVPISLLRRFSNVLFVALQTYVPGHVHLVDDFEPHIVAMMIEFLENRRIEDVAGREIELLTIADFFHIQALTVYAGRIFIQNFSLNNCLANMVHLHRFDRDLFKVAATWIRSNGNILLTQQSLANVPDHIIVSMFRF